MFKEAPDQAYVVYPDGAFNVTLLPAVQINPLDGVVEIDTGVTVTTTAVLKPLHVPLFSDT